MSEDIQTNPELSVPLNDIQARREARRRKILENAKDRLEKLNGRIISTTDDKDGHPKPTTHRTFSDPEIETEELFGPKFPILNSNIPHSLEDNIFGGNSSNAEAELENLIQFFSQINQLPSGQTGQQQQQANGLYTPMMDEPNVPRQPESQLVRFLKTKVHLFIISCITYILFASGKEYFTKYSVFLPLLIWELTETFLLKTNENNANVLFSIAFMMGGISPNISSGLLKIIGTLNKILKDVGVFIFFFVFCHILCTFQFKSQIET